MEHIRKSFGGIVALEDVSVSVSPGEVLALVGDNGAGKSTLIKILSGVLAPDGGIIRLDGREYSKFDTRQAIKLGISTVYQDLALGDTMNVAENLFLGDELTRYGLLCKRRMNREARKILEQFQVNISDERTPVGNLSGGQRQGIAVARLVRQGGRVFVFDEPTAAMGYNEANAVLKLIRHLADQGYAVIMISHNFMQVLDFSDRVCVMRHGRVVAEFETQSTSLAEIAQVLSGPVDAGEVQG